SIVGSWANCSRSWSALNAGMFASPASASSPKAGATVSMSSALGSRKSNPFRRMPSAGKVSAREATSNTREVLVASAGQADEDQLRVETLDAGQSLGRLSGREGRRAEAAPNSRRVLGASGGKADEDQLRVGTLDAGQSMGRLERRQDPF